MHDRIDIPETPDRELQDAFAAMPLLQPRASAWPQLERELRARRPQRPAAWPRWVALAAALALAAVIPFTLERETPEVAPTVSVAQDATGAQPAASPAATDASADPNADLIERNQALGAWLVASGEPFDAASAQLGAELEDMIAMVDMELSDAPDPQRARALWEQRLLLLNELASVRSEGVMRVADIGTGQPTFQNASYRID